MSIDIHTLLNKKLVVSDLDGTLLDLNVNWLSLKSELNNLAIRNGLPQSTFANGIEFGLRFIEQNMSGTNTSDYLDTIHKFETEKINSVNINHRWLMQLSSFQENKHIAIFSSNTRRTVVNALKLQSISSHLKSDNILIIAKEDVSLQKPEPEGLHHILRHFKCSSDDSIFVGNSDLDLEAGKRAGILTIHVSNFSNERY